MQVHNYYPVDQDALFLQYVSGVVKPVPGFWKRTKPNSYSFSLKNT